MKKRKNHSFKKPANPDVLARALSAEIEHIVCVVLETGRMANWLYDELSQRGFQWFVSMPVKPMQF